MAGGQTSRIFTVTLRVLEPTNVMGAHCDGCLASECPQAIQNMTLDSASLMTFYRYGMHLQYDCGKGRAFSDGTDRHATLDSECLWNTSWSRSSFPHCECKPSHPSWKTAFHWSFPTDFGCFDPPLPNDTYNLVSNYTQESTLLIDEWVTYSCAEEYFFEDGDQTPIVSVCQANGVWTTPEFRKCVRPEGKQIMACCDCIASSIRYLQIKSALFLLQWMEDLTIGMLPIYLPLAKK